MRAAWTTQVRGGGCSSAHGQAKHRTHGGVGTWHVSVEPCHTGLLASRQARAAVLRQLQHVGCDTPPLLWVPQEDQQLRQAVARYGERDWTRVAMAVFGRSAKSCSDRWGCALWSVMWCQGVTSRYATGPMQQALAVGWPMLGRVPNHFTPLHFRTEPPLRGQRPSLHL